MPSHHSAEGSELSNRSPPQNISYLYKIEEEDTVNYNWQVNYNCLKINGINDTFCYLQRDVTLLLDLSAFARGEIQVSFAVVGQENSSEFSSTQSVCVDGSKTCTALLTHTLNSIATLYTL